MLPGLLLQAGVKAILQTASDCGSAAGEFADATQPDTNPPVRYPTARSRPITGFCRKWAPCGMWDLMKLFFSMSRRICANIFPMARAAISMAHRPGAWAARPPLIPSRPRRTQTRHGPMKPAFAQSAISIWGPSPASKARPITIMSTFPTACSMSQRRTSSIPIPPFLVNVGGVTTNGVDLAATLHFGDHFHLYDAVSFNYSTYNSS